VLASGASVPPPGDNAVSAADASRLLDAFEEAVEDLRVAYEKYFVGIERQAPASRHRDVKTQMRRLEELRVRSTVVRFRLAGLRARLVTYEYYWTRVLGQIEKGIYRRDLQLRTRRRADMAAQASATDASADLTAAESASAPSTHEPPSDVPRPRAMTEISAPRPTPPSSGPSRPPPPPVSVPGMKGVEVRRLFQDLLRAKQAAGEDIEGLTERALARKLSRELPKLREQHGGPVQFEVATVAGKVRLRARSVVEAE
jgi:hypothetical protein